MDIHPRDPIVTIVLDIDGVLAMSNASSLEEASFFHKRGAIISAIFSHYLFPGAVELVKILLMTPHIRTVFYSSGQKKRNIPFVQELIRRTGMTANPQVLSKDALHETTSGERQKHDEQYRYYIGTYTKDLTKIEGIDLAHALLIEDDYSFAAYGQENNLLYVPRTCEINFRTMSHRKDVYRKDGTRVLRTYLVHESGEEWNENLGRIVLHKVNGKYRCQFRDREDPLKSHNIELTDPALLIQKLDLLHPQAFNQYLYIEITDPSLLDEISTVVESKGGYARKICRQVNRIYYVAGLIFTLIEESQKSGIPVSTLLSTKQYKKGKTHLSIHARSLIKNDLLYVKGLNKLREANPELEFTCPENYSAACKAPIPQETRQFLEETMASEAENCTIQ